jgi:methionyl aminopeptidase
VIHGIPGKRRLREGDLVSIDVGAVVDGYHGDCAETFTVGPVSGEAARLIEVTRQSFFEGIAFARAGCRVSDISHAVQTFVEANGYSVVREFVGHGVGAKLHEDPEVPHYGPPGRGPRLIAGMTFAVEPMVNAGGAAIQVLGDGWTVVTRDGKLSAHYENTILVTSGGPEILTVTDGDG